MSIAGVLVVLLVFLVHRSQCVDYNKLDAFNREICGKDMFLDWHKEAQGFKCSSSNASSHERSCRSIDDRGEQQQPPRPPNRMSFGYPLEWGEFPYHAQLFWWDGHNDWMCQATIVHRDLLITAAHCIKEPPWKGKAYFGTLMKFNRDKLGFDIDIESSCIIENYKLRGYDSWNDLGLVKLAKPIEYTDTVQPVCLNISRQHLPDTTCVSAGHGTGAYGPYPTLRAMPYKWMPNNNDPRIDRSYYFAAHPTWPGNVCNGDSGSSMICFDNCSPDRTRAYSVGVVIDVPKNSCIRGKAHPIQVFDYYKMRAQVERMFKTCLGSKKSGRKAKWYDYE